MLVIGRNPVIETLKSNPETIKKILLLNTLTDNKLKEIAAKAESKNIIVQRVPKQEFEKLLDKKDKSDGISQGIIADVQDFVYHKTTEILKSLDEAGKTKTTLIVLDEITDPHNFGAVIRTAAASRADGIIISDKNSVKVNHTVIKASSGATNYVKISKEYNIYQTMEMLKERGYTIVGTVLNSDTSIYSYEFPEKCAIVFGSEGEGLRKNIINLCDDLIKIPMAGKIESLNVSVSAGVVLFEILRQRNY